MSETTMEQLRKHIDERADRIEERVDKSLVKIEAKIDQLLDPRDGAFAMARSAKHEASNATLSIHGVKTTVDGHSETLQEHAKEITDLKHQTVSWQKKEDKADENRTWRNRLIIGALVGCCGSTVVQGVLLIKAYANDPQPKAKGTP